MRTKNAHPKDRGDHISFAIRTQPVPLTSYVAYLFDRKRVRNVPLGNLGSKMPTLMTPVFVPCVMVFGERVDDTLQQTKCQRLTYGNRDTMYPCADNRAIEEFLRLSSSLEPIRA